MSSISKKIPSQEYNKIFAARANHYFATADHKILKDEANNIRSLLTVMQKNGIALDTKNQSLLNKLITANFKPPKSFKLPF